MNKPSLFAAVAASTLIVGAVGSPLWAQTTTQPLGATQIIQQLEAAGYRNIRGLELDDGLWEADATSPRGFQIELNIDPADGTILNPEVGGGVNAAQVLANLQQQGYSSIRDLEYDDGELETEARDSQGRWVELRLDAQSGAVLKVEVDD